MNTTLEALDGFVAQAMSAFPEQYEHFDPDWRSPCEASQPQGSDAGQIVRWTPVKRFQPGQEPVNDFVGLANALECEIHPSVVDYYGRYWAGGLEAKAEEGHVSLILLWNPADVDRLVENLIGHALVRIKRRKPLTLFFACTEPDSDLLLSVRNSDGTVVVENPHGKIVREVDASLADLLDRLTPAPPLLPP